MFNQLKAAASSFSQSNGNNEQQQQQTQQSNPAQVGTSNTQASSGGDALDKGIDFLSKKMGVNSTHAQTEQYSDMARDQYKKMTGKDVPIADKDYN